MPAYSHPTHLQFAKRSKSIFNIGLIDGKRLQGQIVHYDERHLLIKLDNQLRVVFLDVVSSIESARYS